MISNYTESYNGSEIMISVEANTGPGTHTAIFIIDGVEQWRDTTVTLSTVAARVSIGLKALKDQIDGVTNPELQAILDALDFVRDGGN